MFDRFSIDFRWIFDRFQVVLGSLWGDFGVILGSLLGHHGDFEALCEPFRRRNAYDGTCDGYTRGLESKSENISFSLVLLLLFEGSRAAGNRPSQGYPKEKVCPGRATVSERW